MHIEQPIDSAFRAVANRAPKRLETDESKSVERQRGGGSTGSPSRRRIVRFGFDFDARYDRVARKFGITPANASVEIGDGLLRARYGRVQLSTELSNVKAVAITGPYRFLKTAGPARLGVTDLGLTFASNGRRGVLISFHRRVPGIERLGLLRHGELTVTVENPEALAELLRAECGLP